MTTEEALGRLKAILGKGLYPTAIPKVEEILKSLEKDSFESGFEQATETVGDWYDPKPLSY
jgi:hypothetical protein